MADLRALVREFLGEEDYVFVSSLEKSLREAGAHEDGGIAALAERLASCFLNGDMADFVMALESEDVAVHQCLADENFQRLVLLGLAFGVECENAACANYLGALYYLGAGVPQDYRRAKELYELAASKFLIQAIINLGYIYEYGRVGEPDYERAYRQYAEAAALSGHFEALYKLGDMYDRGRGVERDAHMALELWDRSLREAKGEHAQSQPAFRIARLISDSANPELGLPYDPLGALRLFQLAERGLRISIARGEEYYRPRLVEAIEGQERMRAVLDGPDGALFLA